MDAVTAELSQVPHVPPHDSALDNDARVSKRRRFDDLSPPSDATAPQPPPLPSTSTAGAIGTSTKPHYELRYTLTGHKKSVSSVKFSPDGQWLASACTSPLMAHPSRQLISNTPLQPRTYPSISMPFPPSPSTGHSIPILQVSQT